MSPRNAFLPPIEAEPEEIARGLFHIVIKPWVHCFDHLLHDQIVKTHLGE